MNKTMYKFLRQHRKLILLAFDVFAVTFSYLFTWALIAGSNDILLYLSLLMSSCFLFVSCYAIIYTFMGMYDSLWRYAEIVEFFRCCLASAMSVLIFITITLIMFEERRISISVYVTSAMFASALTLYARLTYRMYRNTKIKRQARNIQRRVLLIGTGDVASSIIHELNKNPNNDINIICAVDINAYRKGRSIMGVEILGTIEDIPELVERCEIETILYAMPHLTEEQKREIMSICTKTNCNLRTVPDISKIISDDEHTILSRIRDVKVEDLLGRDEVELLTDNELIRDRVVMVTGGGGTIGSELCRQIASCSPSLLVIVDIYENNAYSIEQELIRHYGDELNLHTQIASVRDKHKINTLFEQYKPSIVFHAAAHKHVPLMETAPEEAIKNNIVGTYNVAHAADTYGTRRFVLISSDKAVNPTNVMGASKRMCEMVVQYFSTKSKTKFVAVRFGNVLGSNGSVLPLFKDQIAGGGPVTVTTPDIVRYFMTIPEAVRLVLIASTMGDGGEIFVLDMGKPVKILELAENLIKLSGFIPYRDIQITFTGLRPGEKLYEELLQDEEGVRKTTNKKIFIGTPIDIDEVSFLNGLERLKEYANNYRRSEMIQLLCTMVPTYNPHENILPEDSQG